MQGEAERLAEKFCVDEYTDYSIYKYLASQERRPELRRILEELARDEWEHYLFWKRILGRDCRVEVGRGKLRLILLMRKIFGLTFTLKFLERHEEEVIQEYKNYLKYLEGEERRRLEEIIHDEEKHENELIGSIEETIVKYLSFIVLGLADAIVEITGVHAGFLGVTSKTVMAGIAGLVVGLSAAISMASAAYIQAKSDPTRDPAKSALMTGLGYLGAVILLAAPYFIVTSMLIAFLLSLAAGIGLIGLFTFYSSIVFDRPFAREFTESTLLMLGTALASYLFGEALGRHFGLRPE
ncbi:MAG: VIT1/CCC1 family protein [Desulfurococcales archaeon]|nr:VIT1/CCC1 family protein [Desulfurococcales archaeon]